MTFKKIAQGSLLPSAIMSIYFSWKEEVFQSHETIIACTILVAIFTIALLVFFTLNVCFHFILTRIGE